MATLATQSSFYPVCGLATIQRPVACSLLCDDSREAKDHPRPRLTSEQVFLLEKYFHEKPRPPAALRLAVAQQTGLSMQRVGVSLRCLPEQACYPVSASMEFSLMKSELVPESAWQGEIAEEARGKSSHAGA